MSDLTTEPMPSRLEKISQGMALFFAGLFLLMFILDGCQRTKTDPAAGALLTKLEGEGDLITARKIKGEIPADPADPAWAGAKELLLPLVAQTSVTPRVPVFKKTEVSVRALYTTKDIGLRIEWADPTKDENENDIVRFRDAVAVGFPINYGEGIPLPYIGMGNKGRPMNIWHWKASWQADMDRGYQGISEAHEGMVPNVAPIPHRTAEEAGSPMASLQRKSPVENLMAEGFGTLTSVPTKDLKGKGVWKEGRWSVVIRGVRHTKGIGIVPITFAVWDGASRERNGMKGLTRWRFLRFEGEGVASALLKSLIIGPIPGADPKRGRQLVSEMGCVSCHNLPGRFQPQRGVEGEAPSGSARGGGDASPLDVGPDLIHAGSIHRAEYLLESIKEPNAVIVPVPGYYDPKTWTSTMPSFGDQIPEKDYHDIVEYLRGLK